ncbi:cytokine receptor common subunit gamma-like isoform X1 [Acipenser ruthenus]|uniref:cytokine receptor common subunit gamma-like isoform X1 n=1 Tax=Acipenser ruthenus TaxID=7906 RepID=UPI002740DA88|nr:cytokine receptor common subunit gamma-like isoform X1 [Acipenser ruthenus]XP_058845443.1 cytokine receptor common subunit gamma-like isoform X1 [Acipenser ruthenus]
MRVWCWVPVVSEILNRKWKCIYICVELHHRCTSKHRFISREQRIVAVSKGKYQSYRVMERGTALVLTVLLLRGFECSGEASTGVRCLIHDEDYTECTWKETGRPDRNYTFQSRYRTGAEYAECPSYTQVEGYNVGCRLEYNSHMRFATFQVQLSSANNTAIWNKDINLKPLVKLYSPVNLTVDNSSSNGLYLYWNTSMSKSQCLESIVRYRSSTDSAWQNSPTFTSQRYFNLPFADAEELYEFQVKVRINEFCGASDYWSDWSQPAYWGSNATSKDTDIHFSFNPSVVIYPIMGSAVLLILACCLIHNERLRIILVPVIPNPGKNFEELFNSYDGNFQEWLHVSKDIVDGFKPNFSEPVCTVKERAGSMSNSCGGPGGSVRSDCSLLIPEDDPDCVSTSSASSSSTLPAPPYEV